jgi:hypothetical protein
MRFRGAHLSNEESWCAGVVHVSGVNSNSSLTPHRRGALGPGSGTEIIPGMINILTTEYSIKPLPLTNGHGRCITGVTYNRYK